MTTEAERILELEAALGRWPCPSCGGSGVYKHRSAEGASVVPCKLCSGGGLHRVAAEALAHRRPTAETVASFKAMRDALIAIALGQPDEAAGIARAVLRDVEGIAATGSRRRRTARLVAAEKRQGV